MLRVSSTENRKRRNDFELSLVACSLFGLRPSSHMHTAHFKSYHHARPDATEMFHRAPLLPKERLSHHPNRSPLTGDSGGASKRLATWGLNKMLLDGVPRKSLNHTRPKGASQRRKFLARTSHCSSPLDLLLHGSLSLISCKIY
jgi:hypothetical protein